MSIQTARRVLAQHSRSFALAARLLPRDSRDDAAVLYAWCRQVDDAIDLSAPRAAAQRLRGLRAELAAVYQEVPQSDPLLAAFQRLVRSRGIPLAYPSALLDGMATDIGRVRLVSVPELLLYSYRVAGVVGLMMCHVFGVSDRRAQIHAMHLGIAMQLTNVCRDVLEDWERDRIYLPIDLLVRQGATPLAIDRSQRRPIARAVKSLLSLADGYYRSGDIGLAALSFRAALAVRAARLFYSAIGRQLERRGYDVFAGRARVSGLTKLWLLLRAGGAEVWQRLRAQWPAAKSGGEHDPSVVSQA